MGEIFARYQDVASLKLIKKLIVTFLKVIVTFASSPSVSHYKKGHITKR